MANTNFKRTYGASAQKGTISMWVKRTTVGSSLLYNNVSTTGSTNYGNISMEATGEIEFMSVTSGSHTCKRVTKAEFEDLNAWYHFVFVSDLDNGTPDDRLIIYVNGRRIPTSEMATNDNAAGATNFLHATSSASGNAFGSKAVDSSYFNGYMAQVVLVHDAVLTASTFGETDATTGEWKPKADSTIRSAVTFGSQGAMLTFENASFPGYDYQTTARSTTNDYTLAGAGLQSQDSPSNNFAIVNPLWMPYDDPLFYPDKGNLHLQTQTSASTYFGGGASIGLASGKWYWETKFESEAGSAGASIGVYGDPAESARNDRTVGYNPNDWGYRSDATVYSNNTEQDSGMGSYAPAEVIGTYLDLDNNKIYWAVDGGIINSGTGWDITAAASTTNGFYWPGQADIGGSGGSYFSLNFGQGWFNTTLLTGTTYNDAGGLGIFKYSPNDGGASSFDSAAKDFRAICTSNLKTYG